MTLFGFPMVEVESLGHIEPPVFGPPPPIWTGYRAIKAWWKPPRRFYRKRRTRSMKGK
jgi:hypothetical protein